MTAVLARHTSHAENWVDSRFQRLAHMAAAEMPDRPLPCLPAHFEFRMRLAPSPNRVLARRILNHQRPRSDGRLLRLARGWDYSGHPRLSSRSPQ